MLGFRATRMVSSLAHSSARRFASGKKVLCALYPNPQDGSSYENVLGCVGGELGLRKYVESKGYEFVVTSDKDGSGSEFEKHLPDAAVVISQPFWPAYLTEERIKMAPHLKLAITAGVGSDHVDLQAACDASVTVAEVTGSNVVSVAEHVVMQILSLVRGYIPGYQQVINGEWDIAKQAAGAHDLEAKHVGTVAAGRIGYRVLQRLKPFDVNLHYTDKFRLTPVQEQELGAAFHADVADMVPHCDVVTINCPLHPETENLFDAEMLAKCKRGAYIVNTARGKIVDRDALVDALKDGHIAGYAGDVWFPQPAPADHPWRSMPNHAMTPHVSGTTLDAQARYAAGAKELLGAFFDGDQYRDEYLIAHGGKLVSRAYTEGNSTGGAL